MISFEDLKEKNPVDILEAMHKGEFSRAINVPFIVAQSLVNAKIMERLSTIISATGSDLFKASIAIRESTDESIKILKTSIDDFRKSNERTSKVLIWLTGVLGFATCVQAFYAIILIFKK